MGDLLCKKAAFLCVYVYVLNFKCGLAQTSKDFSAPVMYLGECVGPISGTISSIVPDSPKTCQNACEDNAMCVAFEVSSALPCVLFITQGTACAAKNLKTLCIHYTYTACPSCMATVGGTANGANCVFPFQFNGVPYKDCTLITGLAAMAWCATVPTITSQTKDPWGICTSCPVVAAPRSNLVAPMPLESLTAPNESLPNAQSTGGNNTDTSPESELSSTTSSITATSATSTGTSAMRTTALHPCPCFEELVSTLGTRITSSTDWENLWTTRWHDIKNLLPVYLEHLQSKIVCQNATMLQPGCALQVRGPESVIYISADDSLAAFEGLAFHYEALLPPDANAGPVGRLYTLYGNRVPYHAAEALCSNINPDTMLLTLTAVEEQKAVEDMLVKFGYPGDVWLYMTNFNTSCGPKCVTLWRWVAKRDEPVGYSKWGNDQPAANLNCAKIDPMQEYNWTTEDCDQALAYICQGPSPPDHDPNIFFEFTGLNSNFKFLMSCCALLEYNFLLVIMFLLFV